MKAHCSLFLAVLAAGCGGEQADAPPASVPVAVVAPPPPVAPPPVAPVAPADPAPVVDGDVTTGSVNGLRVIVRHTPAETVTVQLYVLGGVRNWGADDAGVEQLALATSAGGGTERLDKDAYFRRLSDLGSFIVAYATSDFSIVMAKTLRPSWEETFKIMVDVFRRPALPDAEVELARVQQLSALKHEQEDPDAKLQQLTNQTIFRGHPYANRAVGTPESVAKLTRTQLVAHLAKLRETSRLVLVVVGDVDATRVLELARDGLGDLPRGDYRNPPLPAWSVAKPEVTLVEQKLPTNYVNAVFPGSSWTDPDLAAGKIAMRLLHEREFEEVRTKRNLSYAPAARLTYYNAAVGVGSLYVTAVDEKAAMQVMLDQARRLRTEPVSDQDLRAIKSMFLTDLYLGEQTTDAQANDLGHAEILGGDWHLARTMGERAHAVTAAQVQEWAVKHLTHLQTVVLGDPTKVDKATLEAL